MVDQHRIETARRLNGKKQFRKSQKAVPLFAASSGSQDETSILSIHLPKKEHPMQARAPRRRTLPALRPLTLALQLICIGALIVAPTLTPMAQAQQTNNGVRNYDIPSGSLTSALTRFIGESGIFLAGTGELTQDKTVAGLRGSYTVQQGFERLLAGTGLEAVARENGNFTLRRLPVAVSQGDSASTLPAVVVSGVHDNSITEGSGSYAARATNTATKLKLSQRETPQTISIVTRQRIDDQSLDSISEVLEQTPGISVQNLGSERFNVYSRGYSVDNYQYDGIPTSLDVVSQISSQSLADMAIYDRVEVLRGPVGLMTGAGDPSATVNLVRKKPTAQFQGYASVGIGSWNMQRTEVDLSGPLNQAGTLRGRVVGAFQKNDSYVDYYHQEKQVFYGVLEADLTDSTLLTAGLDYQKNKPLGGSSTGFPLFYRDGRQTQFARSTNPASNWSFNEQDVLNAFVSVEQKLPADWSLKASVNYLHTDRDYASAAASWGFPNQATGAGVLLYGGSGDTEQTQTGIDLMLQGPFELLGRKHELVLGLSSSEYDNQHQPNRGTGIEGRAINIYTWNNYTTPPVSPGKLYLGSTVIRQTGAYAAVRFKPRDDLALLLGARVSSYDYDYKLRYTLPASQGNNSTTSYRKSDVITPYAGIIYDLNDVHSVYASYTSIFKPQSSRDRTGETLKPREGTQIELGLKSEFFGGRLNTSAALYQIKQDNFAELDPGYFVPNTTSSAYRAVQGAKTNGVDLEVTGKLTPDWNISASYSRSTTEKDDVRLSTVAPANMLKLWSTYRLPGAWNGLTVGGGVNWQSEIYFTASPAAIGKSVTARQESYAVANLMARYEFSKQLSAVLNINNLFDKTYLSALDPTFYSGYYGAPRNASLTLKYQF